MHKLAANQFMIDTRTHCLTGRWCHKRVAPEAQAAVPQRESEHRGIRDKGDRTAPKVRQSPYKAAVLALVDRFTPLLTSSAVTSRRRRRVFPPARHRDRISHASCLGCSRRAGRTRSMRLMLVIRKTQRNAALLSALRSSSAREAQYSPVAYTSSWLH